MTDMVLFQGLPSEQLFEQIDGLDMETKASLLNHLQREHQEEMNKRISIQLENMRLTSDQQSAEIKKIKEQIEESKDTGARRYRGSDKYYTRSVLGDLYAPAISAIRMSKLMIVVGIMTDRDTPYRNYLSGSEPLAKRKPFAEFPTWVFHKDKTDKRINWWLKENGYYNDFHNTTTKDERDALIDMLHEEFGGTQ